MNTRTIRRNRPALLLSAAVFAVLAALMLTQTNLVGTSEAPAPMDIKQLEAELLSHHNPCPTGSTCIITTTSIAYDGTAFSGNISSADSECRENRSWTLEGPSGVIATGTSTNSWSHNLANAPAGTYTITISGQPKGGYPGSTLGYCSDASASRTITYVSGSTTLVVETTGAAGSRRVYGTISTPSYTACGANRSVTVYKLSGTNNSVETEVGSATSASNGEWGFTANPGTGSYRVRVAETWVTDGNTTYRCQAIVHDQTV